MPAQSGHYCEDDDEPELTDFYFLISRYWLQLTMIMRLQLG